MLYVSEVSVHHLFIVIYIEFVCLRKDGGFELKKKKDVVWRRRDIGGKQQPWPLKICWKHLV